MMARILSLDPIPLRNGTTTRCQKLTRLVQFDERSRNYPISALRQGRRARSYTWRCDVVLDQGDTGGCVGFAMTHELIARPKVIRGLDAAWAKEQVYWEAQKIDPWEGGAYPGASPYYEGTSVLAGVKVLHRMGYIKEYRWAFSLDDLVFAVGHHGPAIIGIPWYEDMFTVRGCGHVHVGGQMVGGHALLCNGVNVRERTFTLHNSWGPQWGNNGECKISWDELDLLLHQQGEACIPLSRAYGPE